MSGGYRETTLFSEQQKRRIRSTVASLDSVAIRLSIAIDMSVMQIMLKQPKYQAIVSHMIFPMERNTTFVHISMLSVVGLIKPLGHDSFEKWFSAYGYPDYVTSATANLAVSTMMREGTNDPDGEEMYRVVRLWNGANWQQKQLCCTRLLQRIRRTQSDFRQLFDGYCREYNLEIHGLRDPDIPESERSLTSKIFGLIFR